MEIRVQKGPDQPRPVALVLVVAIGLGAGLLLARRAVGARPPVSSAAASDAPDAVEPDEGAEPSGPTDPAEPGAELEPAEAGAPSDSSPVAVVAPDRSEGTPALSPEPAAPATPAAEAGDSIPEWTRIRHGRVAYLRCEGPADPAAVPEAPIPACGRDAELEALVWRAVDSLADCPTAPRTTGEVDLVVELEVGAAPEIRTRDRFAPEVVRLDPVGVLACVTEPLSAAISTLGAEHVVVSFRFRAVP